MKKTILFCVGIMIYVLQAFIYQWYMNFSNADYIGTTNQLTERGVTWTFENPVQYGTFISGDYWVIGPVNIVSVTPDNEPGYHGAEKNVSSSTQQPYDERLSTYSTGNLLTFPYLAQPGDSLVKTVSVDTSLPSCRPCVQSASILTVLDIIPSSDSFRPQYAGNNKQLYDFSNIRFDLIPQVVRGDLKLPTYSGMNIPNYIATGSSIPSLTTTASYFQYPWIDHITDWVGRDIHPVDHMPDYGGDMTKQIGTAILQTMFDDSIEDKEQTIIGILQYAIDLKGMMLEAGTTFPGNGGHTNGRKLVLSYGGILLDDPQMKGLVQNASQTTFSENNHQLYSNVANRALFGENTTLNENQYWTLIETGNGFRTHKDPYGYIDGGYSAGDHYLFPINAALWKSNIAAMELMPEIKQVWNDQNFIDTVDRYVQHGKWTQPDICAPFDGNVANRGITYGPDGSGGCILDTDPSDGIGRYPNLHGTQRDGGALERYRVPLADAIWDRYITQNTDITDLRFISSGSGGSGSTSSGGISSLPLFNNYIPVISYGQSVSVGAGGVISPNAHGSESQSLSGYILKLNPNKDGLVTMIGDDSRAHNVGMLIKAATEFQENYQNVPSFVGLLKGVSGKTIQELAVRDEHIFQTGDALTNITSVPLSYTFAVFNGTNYDIYINNNGTAQLLTSSRPIPNFYGRILDDFTALKQISDTQQREISDNVFFDWTQGQSNTSALPYGYDYHLKRIISMLESDLSTIAGKPIKVISLINQVSVYSTTSPLAQIQSIFDDEDIHFGGPEYGWNIQYPQRVSDGVGGHLNSLGYRIMGEAMGQNLYDIMTQGNSTMPYIESYQYDSSTHQLTIHFGGLKGNLIHDTSISTQTYSSGNIIPNFIENVQDYFPYITTQGGFVSLTSNVSISGWNINQNSLTLQIQNPNSIDFSILLGERFGSSYISSLRDSYTETLLTNTTNYGDLQNHVIQRRPMMQRINIDIDTSSPIQINNLTNVTPYFTLVSGSGGGTSSGSTSSSSGGTSSSSTSSTSGGGTSSGSTSSSSGGTSSGSTSSTSGGGTSSSSTSSTSGGGTSSGGGSSSSITTSSTVPTTSSTPIVNSINSNPVVTQSGATAQLSQDKEDVSSIVTNTSQNSTEKSSSGFKKVTSSYYNKRTQESETSIFLKNIHTSEGVIIFITSADTKIQNKLLTYTKDKRITPINGGIKLTIKHTNPRFLHEKYEKGIFMN